VGLLGRTGSERALSTLLPLLDAKSDPSLAASAAAALGNIPGKVTAQALLAALDSDEGRVKRAAALAIRRARPAELLAALVTRLTSSGRSDRELTYLALPGPLSQSQDDAQIARAAGLLAGARGGERDQLLEALSASKRAPVRAAISKLASGAEPGDRAKAAELLSAAPDPATLARLSKDADARVRANAVWSLGFVDAAGASLARQALLHALGDREASVVGNAAVSLGRLARGDAHAAA